MENNIFQKYERLAALAKRAGYDAEKLALLYGCSPRQFRRFFQRECDCSPRQWLKDLKLVKAVSGLLAHEPLKQLASELGYDHLPNFCRWFKQRTGLRPTEYINRESKDRAKSASLQRMSDFDNPLVLKLTRLRSESKPESGER